MSRPPVGSTATAPNTAVAQPAESAALAVTAVPTIAVAAARPTANPAPGEPDRDSEIPGPPEIDLKPGAAAHSEGPLEPLEQPGGTYAEFLAFVEQVRGIRRGAQRAHRNDTEGPGRSPPDQRVRQHRELHGRQADRTVEMIGVG